MAQSGRDCDGYLIHVSVPDGFCVMPFADNLGPVRHLVVHPSGAVVAARRTAPGIVILRDTDGDGIADLVTEFGHGEGGHSVAWAGDWLYFASEKAIVRWRWPAQAAEPTGEMEWLAEGLPYLDYGYAHNQKGIAVHPDGSVYVSFGSASDNCAPGDERAPGRLPCPDLETRAGIWRLVPGEGAGEPWRQERVATGLRNAMPIAVDPRTDRIWAMGHGRDALNRRWGWTNEESALQPAEMLFEVIPGSDHGWPYCMPRWSPEGTPTLVRAPEYQGVADPRADCESKTLPARVFPGHWAPMALTFSTDALPEGWRHGAFLVFHGSRGRRPLPEDGHYALFVTLDSLGAPLGPQRIFAVSGQGPGALRLSGVAIAADGHLFLSDDDHGRIFMVRPGAPIER